MLVMNLVISLAVYELQRAATALRVRAKIHGWFVLHIDETTTLP